MNAFPPRPASIRELLGQMVEGLAAVAVAVRESRELSSLEARLLAYHDRAPLSVPEAAKMLRRSEADIAEACAVLNPVHGGRVKLYRLCEIERALVSADREKLPAPKASRKSGATVAGGAKRAPKGGARWSLR